jgi:hypothetical protein
MNNYYTPTGVPSTDSKLNSSLVRNEFSVIGQAFDKMPVLDSSGNLPVFVNPAGSKLEVRTAEEALALLGAVGLSENKVQFPNEAGSIVSQLSNINTSEREYTYQDRSGTIALRSDIPVGTVSMFIGGYYTDADNGGFVGVTTTAAAFNALYNDIGLYAANGAALNHPLSPYWNAANRYLPKIDDDRFFMGSNSCGAVGGSNTDTHVHDVAHTHANIHTHYIDHVHSTGNFALTEAHNGPHQHTYVMKTTVGGSSAGGDAQSIGLGNYATSVSGSGVPHNHGNTGTSTAPTSGGASANSGAASITNSGVTSVSDKRPLFIKGIAYVKAW